MAATGASPGSSGGHVAGGPSTVRASRAAFALRSATTAPTSSPRYPSRLIRRSFLRTRIPDH